MIHITINEGARHTQSVERFLMKSSGGKIIKHLKKEHLNKSKTLQIQFWDKFVLFLKSNPNNIATELDALIRVLNCCLLYTSPSPRDRTRSRMPSSA